MRPSRLGQPRNRRLAPEETGAVAVRRSFGIKRLGLAGLVGVCLLSVGMLSACSGSASDDLADQSARASDEGVVPISANIVTAPQACDAYTAEGAGQQQLQLLAERLATVEGDAPTEAMANAISDAATLDQSDAAAVVDFFSALPEVTKDYRAAHDDSCVPVLERFLERGQQIGLS